MGMTLRVLQVDSGVHAWDGTMKYLMDISTALARRGHAVTIACPGRSIQARCADDRGLQKVAFEMGSAHDWRQLPRFLRAVAGKYEVVHIHSPLDYVVPAMAARLGKIPAVVMTRHLPHPFATRRNAYICTSLLYDRTIAVSSFVRNVMVDSGARPERIEVVPNGIDFTAPDPEAGQRLRGELNIPHDAVLVAAAGRISPQKGFDTLLKAIDEITRGGVALYCVIFGAGPALEDLRTLGTTLRLGAGLRLPGFRRDVSSLWCAADIAVIPSAWPEPFGYVAIEALSAGCPIVASRVGGLPEVLSDDSAILTEPGDAGGLAAAIRSLALSPGRRKVMRQAATRRAKLFTMDANVTHVERIYTELLQRRNPRRADISALGGAMTSS
jgi:glycosyltransferase involved in cell wall biosynthesis